MKSRIITITAIVLALFIIVWKMAVFTPHSLTAVTNNGKTIIGSGMDIADESAIEMPVTDGQVFVVPKPTEDGALDFSLNDALALIGINVIVDPRNWGISEIFDQNGYISNDGEITWSFVEVQEEEYRGFESSFPYNDKSSSTQ
jgi:uncharacterized membrane-anchored protein